MSIEDQYLSGDYLRKNPSWDQEDSPWKTKLVARLLRKHDLQNGSICEVGCGAGGVLAGLRGEFPDVSLSGFDISPEAESFWGAYSGLDITFKQGDFFEIDSSRYDVVLLLDVLEHVANPWEFLERINGRANRVIIHFPLDLSANSVLREQPLMYVRRKVGHLHYYTRRLALELLDETGYEVTEWFFTGASQNAPVRSWKTRLARLPRRLMASISPDLAARCLGGETLMVFARALNNTHTDR